MMICYVPGIGDTTVNKTDKMTTFSQGCQQVINKYEVCQMVINANKKNKAR